MGARRGERTGNDGMGAAPARQKLGVCGTVRLDADGPTSSGVGAARNGATTMTWKREMRASSAWERERARLPFYRWRREEERAPGRGRGGRRLQDQ
jgi:hypothetical protein